MCLSFRLHAYINGRVISISEGLHGYTRHRRWLWVKSMLCLINFRWCARLLMALMYQSVGNIPRPSHDHHLTSDITCAAWNMGGNTCDIVKCSQRMAWTWTLKVIENRYCKKLHKTLTTKRVAIKLSYWHRIPKFQYLNDNKILRFPSSHTDLIVIYKWNYFTT